MVTSPLSKPAAKGRSRGPKGLDDTRATSVAVTVLPQADETEVRIPIQTGGVSGPTKRRKIGPHERLRVYQMVPATAPLVNDLVWDAMLPVSELQRHLPIMCRYTTDSVAPKVLGAVLGTLVGGLLLVLFFKVGVAALLAVASGDPVIPVIKAFPLGLAIFAAIPLGGIPGVLLGWRLGPALGPQPMWIIKRSWEMGQWNVEPVVHTGLRGDVWLPDQNGTRPKQTHIYRASFYHQGIQMTDEKDFLSGPKDKWQTVQLTLLVILAIAMAGLLILFIIATTKEPSTPTGSPPPAVQPIDRSQGK